MKVPKFHPGPAYGGLTEQDLAALIRSNLVRGLPPVRRDG